MRMLVRLVFGLFVLKAAIASPRFSRQVDLDTYDLANYDEEEDNFDLDNGESYDYDEELTTDESETETETPNELDYNYPPEDLEEEKPEEEEEEDVQQEKGEEEENQEEKEEEDNHEEEYNQGEENEEEELPLTPQLIPQGSGGSGVLMGPETQKEEELLPTTPEPSQEVQTSIEETMTSGDPEQPEEEVVDAQGMPVCLLCTCLGGSVYCDDLKLDSVPPLPKDTTHFYARYNKITKINKSDFANMNKLKRIDLTANEITAIDDKAFMGLPALEQLIIRENHVSQLPALPETMTLIDGSHNNIGSRGIHKEAFKDMTSLQFLYLTDNNIDYIPVPLPDSLRSIHLQRNNIQMMHEDTFCNLNDFNYIRNALEDIRLDGNPINLSKTPQAYICLPRIPVGNLV
uniref:Epiphycan n=1 Tax=Nothobranchius rachovii TaxID=451742 RepID=A0A1A8SBB6_9TELE